MISLGRHVSMWYQAFQGLAVGVLTVLLFTVPPLLGIRTSVPR